MSRLLGVHSTKGGVSQGSASQNKVSHGNASNHDTLVAHSSPEHIDLTAPFRTQIPYHAAAVAAAAPGSPYIDLTSPSPQKQGGYQLSPGHDTAGQATPRASSPRDGYTTWDRPSSTSPHRRRWTHR
jgi:hypothetical protein